ncbi:MAG: hypothetical protein V5A28_09965 [Haloarculaceae archaeon]
MDGIALSDIIVSVAEGVSEANQVLNEDPQSQLTISQFDIETSLYASLSTPRSDGHDSVGEYPFRATDTSTYRIERPERTIQAARLQNWARPKLTDTALLGERTESARVQINATLEAVPTVEQS